METVKYAWVGALGKDVLQSWDWDVGKLGCGSPDTVYTEEYVAEGPE